MNLSPAPFLRLGFAILGFAVALAVWFGGAAAGAGWWRLAAGLAAAFVVAGIGEMIFRRVASPEAIRADLEDRVRNEP